MTHKSFGVLTQYDIDMAMRAPAGGALKIIQEKDPEWGTSDMPLKEFKVTVSREKTVQEVSYIFVSAETEEIATKKASEMDDCDFVWEEKDEYVEDSIISDCCEVTEKRR